MYRITVVYEDGSETTSLQEKKPNLDQIQKAVKGYIELIPDFEKLNGMKVEAVWGNEEAKLIGMPINHFMTSAWRGYLDSTGRPYDWEMATLCGPIMIVQRVGKEQRA